jgi:hypothetical protein
MKINPNEFGNPPALTPEDFDGDTVILTVHKVEVYKGFGGGRQVGIHTAEFPDKALYLNRTMLTTLTNKLGSETNAWIGARVPFEVVAVRNPQTNQDVNRIYPVNATQWDSVLAEASAAAAPASRRKRGK